MTIKIRLAKGAVCSVLSILAIVFNFDDNLNVSENGLMHIANAEGCRQQAYQCSAERWTIGLGHAIKVKAGEAWSEEEIAIAFIDDIENAETVVKRLITQPATQGEFDMMVSFVFNLGAGNFAKSTLLKKFNSGDKSACDEYLNWIFVSGKDCRKAESKCHGILSRRKIEAKVCKKGWSDAIR